MTEFGMTAFAEQMRCAVMNREARIDELETFGAFKEAHASLP